MEVYAKDARTAAPEYEPTENPRPYGFKVLLRSVKEAVPIERLAEDLGQGRCPIHGGQSRDAFRVYPEQGKWHCFRCNEGGDVLDLYQKAKGYYDRKAALTDLAGMYGVQAPPRPERWHRWQGEKGTRISELQRWRERRYQRRLYKMFAADSVAAIEDQDERAEEARRAWEELGALARVWAVRSMG